MTTIGTTIAFRTTSSSGISYDRWGEIVGICKAGDRLNAAIEKLKAVDGLDQSLKLERGAGNSCQRESYDRYIVKAKHITLRREVLTTCKI